MGKKAPKAPPIPDPFAIAGAQAGANKEAVRESARVNQINEVSPFGTLNFTGEIGEPDRTRTISLNPSDQQGLDTQRALSLALTQFANSQVPNITDTLGSPLDFSGLTPLGGREGFGAERGNVENSVFQRGLNLLNPEIDRQRRQLDTNLVNRGLPSGGEAATGAVDDFERRRGQSLENLALSAVQAGGAEQSRLFGLDLQGRQQGMSELLTQRATPINELSAILQGAPATQNPQFAPQAKFGVAPADFGGAFGLQQAGQLAQFNAANANRNADMGGLFGLGSAGIAAAIPLMFCSRRFKTNGRPVSEILPRIEALTIEAWDYLPGIDDGGTHIGPYAEEFSEMFGVGDGVTIHPVDAFGVCLLGLQELSQRLGDVETMVKS